MKSYIMWLSVFLKCSPIVYAFSFLMAVLIDSKALVLSMVIFVFVDLITGLWKAFVIKEKITSKALRRTTEKLLTYFFVIVLAAVLDKTVLKIELFNVSTLVAGLILLVEFKSVTENMGIITGNTVFIKIYELVETIFNKKKNE